LLGSTTLRKLVETLSGEGEEEYDGPDYIRFNDGVAINEILAEHNLTEKMTPSDLE
jgi:hypothetical protein